MYTLKEQYKKHILIKKIINSAIITENINTVILEGFTEEEIDDIDRALGEVENVAKKHSLSTLLDASTKAAQMFEKASGMLGNIEKLKADVSLFRPFSDGMSEIVTFLSSFTKFANTLPKALEVLDRKIKLTDEQKIKSFRNAITDDKALELLEKALKVSLKPAGILGGLGVKTIPFLDVDAFIDELMSTTTFNALTGVAEAVPDKVPVDSDDARSLFDAQKGDKEALDSLVDIGGKDNKDKKDADPSDEVTKAIKSGSAPKPAILNAIESWGESLSDEAIDALRQDDRINKLRGAIDDAFESTADTVKAAVAQAVKGWVDDVGVKLAGADGNPELIPLDALEKLEKLLPDAVEQLLTVKYESYQNYNAAAIAKAVRKFLDKSYNNIL